MPDRIFDHVGEDGWKVKWQRQTCAIPHLNLHTACSRWPKPTRLKWPLFPFGCGVDGRKALSWAAADEQREKKLQSRNTVKTQKAERKMFWWLYSHVWHEKCRQQMLLYLHLRVFMQLQTFTNKKSMKHTIHFWKYNRENITVSEIFFKCSKWNVQFK